MGSALEAIALVALQERHIKLELGLQKALDLLKESQHDRMGPRMTVPAVWRALTGLWR